MNSIMNTLIETPFGGIHVAEAIVLVISLFAIATILYIIRIAGKDAEAHRWVLALQDAYEALETFVEQADVLHDQIISEYGEIAKLKNQDPRLLWVIDRFEQFIQKQYHVNVDVNWVIDTIERILRENKTAG